MNYTKNRTYYENLLIFILGVLLVILLYNKNLLSVKDKEYHNNIHKYFIKPLYNYNKFILRDKNKIHYIYLENKFLKLKISNLGGQINEVTIKKYKAYKDINPLTLLKNSSSVFSFIFKTKEGGILNTCNLYFNFISKSTHNGVIKIVMRSSLSDSCYIDFIYLLNKDYKLDFFVKTKGLGNIINSNLNKVKFFWQQKIFSIEKDRGWESNYTQLYYAFNNNSNVKYLSESRNENKKIIKKINWIAYKQQFFSSILVFNNNINSYFDFNSKIYHKSNTLKVFNTFAYFDINNKNQEFMFTGNWYFIPLKYQLLKSCDKNFEQLIPLGWGFLRLMNIHFFLNIFDLLTLTKLNYGVIIILMTLVVKLFLSIVIYHQYKLNAMIKIIKPDIERINYKYRDCNSIEKQKLLLMVYKKAGINPLTGCLPAILQIPIFYALFKFFPTIIDLRGKSFFWADDLTSYDSIFHLPFYIPIYGDHVSLFTILYTISLIFYTKITNEDNINYNHNKNNYFIYLMPIIMLIFINRYASGLSLYYFVSNIINILLIFLIKKFFIKEKNLRNIININRSKFFNKKI